MVIYAGQYDPLLGPALASAWTDKIMSLASPSLADAYRNAPKTMWRVDPEDKEVAGYARSAGNFTFLMVRSAGHIVPHDQPERALDIMDRVLTGRPFP